MELSVYRFGFKSRRQAYFFMVWIEYFDAVTHEVTFAKDVFVIRNLFGIGFK